MQEIIGQFGVGFYSAFMVADKIEVYSKSSVTPGPGYLWTSDGSGKYTMQEVEGLQPGTKIVLSLRKEDAEFSDETIVRDIVKKYSNFVGTDVLLNGDKINTLQPVWLMDPKEVDASLHEEFYRFRILVFLINLMIIGHNLQVHKWWHGQAKVHTALSHRCSNGH